MIDTPEHSYPDPDPTELNPDAALRFPWPPAESEPVVGGLVDTWREAVLRPAAFFRAMPPQASSGAAMLYYLVIGILSAAVQLFWGAVLPGGTSFMDGLFGTAPDVSPLVEFLLSPLYLLVSLFIAAAVTHLMVLILVANNRGFGTTLRVMAYAYSPVLLGVVPYVGAIAGFIWMVVISIIGLRETHRTSTGRAATAVLVPLVVAILFIAIAAIMLVAAGGLLLS